jgi:hypothetical protein
MGEIKATKELITIPQKQQEIWKIEYEIRQQQARIESLKDAIKEQEITGDLNSYDLVRTIHRGSHMQCLYVRSKTTGKKVCKMYGTTDHQWDDTLMLAHKMTKIPELVKIAHDLASDEIYYGGGSLTPLRKMAKSVIEDLKSLENYKWGKGDRQGQPMVKMTKKEIEKRELSESSLPVADRSFPF